MKHLKQEFDKLTFKELTVYTIAAIGQIAAIILVFIGLYIEPKGEIHSSVLTYYGVECGFTSMLLGISSHYSAELTSFKTKVQTILDSANTSAKPEPAVGLRSGSQNSAKPEGAGGKEE